MDPATLILIALAIGLIILAYRQGPDTVQAGWQGTWRATKNLLPLLLTILFIVGFGETLLPRELVVRLLGENSGWRGILVACGLGAITPGGPFVSYPLVATLYKAGAGLGPLVAYTTAWSLWALSRLPLEISLVGVRLTSIRLLATLVFPPLSGLIVNLFFTCPAP